MMNVDGGRGGRAYASVGLAFACLSSTLTHSGAATLLAAQQSGAEPGRQAPRHTTAVPPLAFTGVTVVDVANGRHLPAQTVVVVGSRIQAVGPGQRVSIPSDAQVVDGRGKYLIPGLWDMHVHTDDMIAEKDTWYPRFIANGVTGIREMGQRFDGGVDSFYLVRRAIAAGMLAGPRLAGPSVDLSAQLPGISTADDARRAIDSLKAAGMTFVKFHNDFDDGTLYFAYLREARRLGLPFVGHVPIAVTGVQAADSGQLSIEHLNENRPCATDSSFVRSSDSLADSVSTGCLATMEAYIRDSTWMTPIMGAIGAAAAKPDWWGYRLTRRLHRMGFRRFLAGSDVALFATGGVLSLGRRSCRSCCSSPREA